MIKPSGLKLADAPAHRDVIPIRPVPVLTRVSRMVVQGQSVTGIMRHWAPGDSGPGGRCKRCAECSAYQDGCLVLIDRRLTDDEMKAFSGD